MKRRLSPRAKHDLIPFLELLLPQQVMIVLREPMGLVAHVLQQPQRRGMPAQAQRLRLAGAIDFLLALGQRDQARRLLAQHAEDFQRRVELALAAVDEQDVGKHLLLSPRRALRKRRAITSRIDAKSSTPSTDLIL